MTVDISHLPKSLQRKPEVRALSLHVIPMRDGRLIVDGSEYGYEFWVTDGRASRCTCPQGITRDYCAHSIAIKRYLEERRSTNGCSR